MLYLLCEKLKIHPISRISYPNIEKMAEYAAMINRREPKIRNVIGFVDGLKLHQYNVVKIQSLRIDITMDSVATQLLIMY